MGTQATVQAQQKSSPISTLQGGILQRKCACGQHTMAGGECESCRKKHASPAGMASATLQRAAIDSIPRQPGAVPPIVGNVLKAPGHPLDTGTRSFMESRFGHDFSQVRVHTDPQAAESASAVHARAYTVGQDVVFGAGQYAPETATGQHLLAHELTHTVQQQGLQRYASDGPLSLSTHDGTLEHEAEAAASAVTSTTHATNANPVSISQHPVTPTISRAKQSNVAPEDEKKSNDIGVKKNYNDVTGNIEVGDGQHVVGIRSKGDTMAFAIDAFILPPQKGPAKKRYDTMVENEKLVAKRNKATGNAIAEESAGTEKLKKYWLEKVGWPVGGDKASTATQNTNWYEAGGAENAFPKVGTKTCNMDHIVELQVSGTNEPANVQVLDDSPNKSSGSKVRHQLAGLTRDIKTNKQIVIPPDISVIILDFQDVRGTDIPCEPKPDAVKGKASSCTDVECNATAGIGGSQAGQGEVAKKTQPYPIAIGDAEAILEINPPPQTETDLSNSKVKLIPGVIFTKLVISKGKHILYARLDAKSSEQDTQKTSLPIAILPAQNEFHFTVVQKEGKGHLHLEPSKKELKFTHPHLSEGHLSLTFNEKQGLSGNGILKPSLPLLRNAPIKVTLEEGNFSGTLEVPPDKLQFIPGFKVTESTLTLELSPELAAKGKFSFKVGSVLDGSLKASADTSGFVAEGNIFAHLPGVDKADGNLKYQQKAWTGGIEIKTTQIKIPGLESSTLRLTLSDTGLTPSGEVTIKLGQQKATLSVVKHGDNWIYSGQGKFDVPGLKTVDLDITYDGKQLSGDAHTNFELKGLQGRLHVKYRDGRVTGDGKLDVKRGRATGFIAVNMSDAYKFSGKGQIDYQFSENLIGTLGIELPENGDVRIIGGVKFPKPITLFKGFEDSRELFKYSVDIPIFAIPLGPVSVGLVAIISARLNVHYGIGPGQLVDVSVLTAFNPLAEQTNFELAADATLTIPARAGVSLTINGDLGVDLAVATVSGGIGVTGTADLVGGLNAGVHVVYAQGKFALKADAELKAALKLLLGIDAHVGVEAGILGIKYEARKVWQLASYGFDTGLEFGLKAPIHYASDEPFHFPSFSDITWTTPNIDAKAVLPRLVRQARGEDR